ncbi:hypothetical protein A3F06_03915 [candidate division TM6 bacterium RIFCSPHIGHO2_12_FULL_36_22]|nr:MAG: hypothetical protein A3F06_03915 [candidate division TM6 bacterium RIFCSPHIGHO2_12_FULL_36_22]
MITPIYTWLIVAIMLSAIEMLSPGLFFFLSFSLGAFITAFLSLKFGALSVQLSIFLLSSFGSFLVLHQWLKRKQAQFRPATETNMDALRGKTGYISSVSTYSKDGILKIGGDIWTARAIDGSELRKGAQVEVIGIKGCHVQVKELKKQHNSPNLGDSEAL